jgi:hypothetical protein
MLSVKRKNKSHESSIASTMKVWYQRSSTEVKDETTFEKTYFRE